MKQEPRISGNCCWIEQLRVADFSKANLHHDIVTMFKKLFLSCLGEGERRGGLQLNPLQGRSPESFWHYLCFVVPEVHLCLVITTHFMVRSESFRVGGGLDLWSYTNSQSR